MRRSAAAGKRKRRGAVHGGEGGKNDAQPSSATTTQTNTFKLRNIASDRPLAAPTSTYSTMIQSLPLCHESDSLVSLKTKPIEDDSCLEWDANTQQLTSAASNSLEEDWRTWMAPPEYDGVPDNTEGIAAFADLPFPDTARLLIDVGGGEFDATRHWVEHRYCQIKMLVVDPFKRSQEHNAWALALVHNEGGADIATSMSVLNVIDTRAARIAHVSTLFGCLRQGGVAYFKVWAGSGALRGSGSATIDEDRGVYQANAFASAFEIEVRSVFGDAVEVIEEMNLIVAIKV